MQGIRTGYSVAFYHSSVYLKILYSQLFLKSDFLFAANINLLTKLQPFFDKFPLESFGKMSFSKYFFLNKTSLHKEKTIISSWNITRGTLSKLNIYNHWPKWAILYVILMQQQKFFRLVLGSFFEMQSFGSRVKKLGSACQNIG